MQALLDFGDKLLTYEELRRHPLVERTTLNDAWREVFITKSPEELKQVIIENGLEDDFTKDMISLYVE